MNKRDARAAVRERMGGKRTSAIRQIRCVLTWPFFIHAYDAIFVPRLEKQYSYYEHCVCCGRARSWVSFGSNDGKPGSVRYWGGRHEERVES